MGGRLTSPLPQCYFRTCCAFSPDATRGAGVASRSECMRQLTRLVYLKIYTRTYYYFKRRGMFCGSCCKYFSRTEIKLIKQNAEPIQNNICSYKLFYHMHAYFLYRCKECFNWSYIQFNFKSFILQNWPVADSTSVKLEIEHVSKVIPPALGQYFS